MCHFQAASDTRQLKTLPLVSKDPFDRMLIAQAISEPLVLLTRDHALSGYGDCVMLV
jgi:PIN domain nuclease of toxin-antitoxin system